ncbi:MAG: hypothetical protein KC451_10175 [Amylibacter sp.]|jgi:hypothetical protein|nr:hypothetical protein [Amylibacter sp.]
MDKHGFERIDEVLVTLAKELDVNLHKKAIAAQRRSEKIGFPVLRDPPNQMDDSYRVNNRGLDDLLERMNARFETVANRIWHS